MFDDNNNNNNGAWATTGGAAMSSMIFSAPRRPSCLTGWVTLEAPSWGWRCDLTQVTSWLDTRFARMYASKSGTFSDQRDTSPSRLIREIDLVEY